MSITILIKKNIQLGPAYSFRGLVHYHHCEKHGSMQADKMKKELRFLHLDLQATRKELRSTLGIA